ncbi:MAG: GTPase HflX, partial [Clostridia bacterium]|nr:GTPase HflX [Clostridia bacterium]
GDSLSRQGGGIGSTGPGESKLEMDRRYIKTRIKGLERKLKEVQKRQKLQVNKREKSNVKTVAVVGYTNVGKSTLVNTLCGSDILELNQVFATLDLTARSTKIYDEKVIFIDTVGFIRELPETLMEAFKSTLEIAKYADLIVCVADASAEFKNQREVADEILNSIGANQNRLYILNKSDIPTKAFIDKDFITVSAKEKVGLTKLKDAVYERLFGQFTEYKLEINYESSPVLQKLKTLTMTANIEYLDDKIIVMGLTKRENVDKIKNLI